MMNNQEILKERKQFSLFDEVKNTKNRDEIIQRYQLSENPFIFSEDDFIPTPFDEVDKKFLDPSNDFNTAKHLFEILKIDRIQASDQRLWTTLTHTVGWEYMQGRWNIRDTRKNTDLKEFILSRWHYGTGSIRNALARNAFSRLWWAAELTYAPWEKNPKFNCFKSDDPYKFTRILSETNKSQAIVDVLEREFGASLLFRICFLQAFNILIEEKGLTPTLASAKLSVLFNALLIPRSVSAHEDSPEELLKRILNLQEFINVKKSPETT